MRSALIHKHEACLSKQTHSGSAKTHLQRQGGVGSAMATDRRGSLTASRDGRGVLGGEATSSRAACANLTTDNIGTCT